MPYCNPMRHATVLFLVLSACGGSATNKEETGPPAPVTQAAPAPAAEPAPAPTCDSAATHVGELLLASDEMKAAPREQQDAARTMVASLVDEIAKECRERGWSEAQLACIAGALRMEDLEKCDVKKDQAGGGGASGASGGM